MNRTNPKTRKGAVTPMFAILLPVLVVMCGFAINMAYMQQVSTEMKVAADAAAHAGGRAMSIEQNTDDAIAVAQDIAELNLVGGRPMALTTPDSDDDIQFGFSSRTGNSRYTFTRYSKEDVDNGVERATSFCVQGRVNLPLLFTAMPGSMTSFDSSRRSVATQVDRDIALVIDRSGSMLYYENETALSAALYLLSIQEVEVVVPAIDPYVSYEFYRYLNRYGTYRYYRGRYSIAEGLANGWVYDPSTARNEPGEPETTEMVTLIDEDEYDDATRSLYSRRYSDNVVAQLATINQEMSEYTEGWEIMIESDNSWNDRSPAPPHSRWDFLVDGVDAFLDVLESTDQEERVALIVFNHNAVMEYELRDSYQAIRDEVDSIVPYNGTAIGDAMLVGHPEIVNGTNARPFAAKTIVVLTDGEDTSSDVAPATAANQIVAADAVTIHTVTFATDDVDALGDMDTVAETGNGVHYHAENGAELITTFEIIANNLPTILTE